MLFSFYKNLVYRNVERSYHLSSLCAAKDGRKFFYTKSKVGTRCEPTCSVPRERNMRKLGLLYSRCQTFLNFFLPNDAVAPVDKSLPYSFSMFPSLQFNDALYLHLIARGMKPGTLMINVFDTST